MKILIVDDNPDELVLAQRLLSKEGFSDVQCAQSAIEAYAVLGIDSAHTSGSDIDVVLLDIHMPVEDGIAACRRIKADPRLPDLAVIMVTADTGGGEVLPSAFAAGAMDYITKPYSRQELPVRVRSAERLVSSLRALRKSEGHLRQITSALGEGLFVMDEKGRLTFMNPEAERLLGWREDELKGEPAHDAIHYLYPDGAPYPAERCPVLAVTSRGDVYRTEDDIFVRRDGSFLSVAYVATPLLDDEGQLAGVVTAFQDITERKKMEAELRFAAKLVDASANGIMATDPDGTIRMVNPAFTRITGYTLKEVQGKKPNILHSGRHGREFYQEMWHALLTHGHWRGEVWNRRKDRTIYPEWLSISAIYDQDGRVERYMAVFLDITEHKEIEARLKHMANHDSLTGLPNRLLLADRLTQALTHARRGRHAVALLFIDLDGFKPINDELGHDAGDWVLKEIADRLTHCVRASDTVSRMGGDEFVILLDEIQGGAGRKAATAVAEKVLEAVPQPVRVEGQTVRVGASIGIALYPEHGRTPDALITAADTAMYKAKEAGRMQYCFCEDARRTNRE